MQIKRRKAVKARKEKNREARKRLQGAPLAERRIRALRLRQQGMSYDRIGKRLDIGIGAAYQDVMSALNEIDEKRKEAADQLRVLEITRLDRLIEKLEAGLRKKKSKIVVGKGDKRRVIEVEKQDVDLVSFIHSYIRIMDRRSRYIAGLDAPKEVKADVSERLKEAMESAGDDVVGILKRLAGEDS